MRIRNGKVSDQDKNPGSATLVISRVRIRITNEYPHPAFQLNADPDPVFLFNSDTGTDPAPHRSYENDKNQDPGSGINIPTSRIRNPSSCV